MFYYLFPTVITVVPHNKPLSKYDPLFISKTIFSQVFTFNWSVNCLLISLQDRIEKLSCEFWLLIKTTSGISRPVLDQVFSFRFVIENHRKTHSQTPVQAKPTRMVNLISLPISGAESPSAWRVSMESIHKAAVGRSCSGTLAVCHQLSALSPISGMFIFLWVRKENQSWLSAYHFEQYLFLLLSRELHHSLVFIYLFIYCWCA